MLFGSMAFIFEVMIYVGLGLPLVNLLLGLVGGADGSGGELGGELSAETGGDLDLDMSAELELDLDGTGAELAAFNPAGQIANQGVFVRFNVYCLCLAMVVMGAVGVFAMTSLEGVMQLAALLGGGAGAMAAYILLYRLLILPLKKNDAAALNARSLRFRHAKVTFRILKGSPGQIETRDAVGAVITYRAELDPDICKLDRIEEREEVVITDIDYGQNLCYVTLAQRKILS